MWTEYDKVALPIALGVITLITFLLWLLLRNKSERVKNIPFIAITVLMLSMEVYKQVINLPNYNYWNLPLHFCSLFMVWFSLASFGKGKVKEVGFTISVVSSFMFYVVFYVDPYSVIGSGSQHFFERFGAFHTFTYHHLITQFSFLALAFKRFNPKLEHIKHLIICYAIFFIIAAPLAYSLNTNFAGLLTNKGSIPATVKQIFGQYFYTYFMLFFCVGWAVINLVVSYFVKKVKNLIKFKRQRKLALAN